MVAAHQKSVVLQLSIPGRNARTAEIQLETPAECDRLTVAIQRAAVVAFDRQSPVNVSTAGGISEALMAAHEDAERYKADHLATCETIAQMHAAATGRPGEGPIRGVVEDVTDLRERAVALEAALVAMTGARDALADLVAEHYPIAIAARAFMNDEATEDILRATADHVINSKMPDRLAMLPARITAIVEVGK